MAIFPRQARAVGYLYLLNFGIPFYFAVTAYMAVVRDTAICLLIVFVPVYILSFRAVSRLARLLTVAAETVLTLALVVIAGPGFSFMMIYPCTLMAVYRPRRTTFLYPAAMLAATASAALVWSTAWSRPLDSYWSLVGTAALTSFASMAGVFWQMRLVHANRELEDANAHIERLARVAERERISRDMHDVLGHELSLIALKAQLVERLVAQDPQRARAEAQDIEGAARQALTQVREYIAGIKQPSFREEWRQAVSALRAADIYCNPELDEAPPEGDVKAIALAMCLRESVTNVVQHSRAQTVHLHAGSRADGWSVMVADDGVGMEQGSRDGRGIPGLLARMAAVGGFAAIWSGDRWRAGNPGAWLTAGGRPGPFARGTVVCLWAPREVDGG